MILDAILVGKGSSIETFPWGKVLEDPVTVCINEAILCIPQDAPMTTLIGMTQDYDPVRRIIDAWKPDTRVKAIWYADMHAEIGKKLPCKGVVFPLSTVPRGATACIALWFIRKWASETFGRQMDDHLNVGCVGFDAYFGRGGPVYAKAVQDAVKEPITRSPDYSAVNAQIGRWARETNCRLIDLGAEAGPTS